MENLTVVENHKKINKSILAVITDYALIRPLVERARNLRPYFQGQRYLETVHAARVLRMFENDKQNTGE